MHFINPLLGGALIGLAAALLLLANGRVLGVSGIVSGLFQRESGKDWRLAVILGIFSGGFILQLLRPKAFQLELPQSLFVLAVAGILVGFGTRLGSGCTSGHGICGVSRLSKRSLIATITFMAAGAATVYVVRHVMEVYR